MKRQHHSGSGLPRPGEGFEVWWTAEAVLARIAEQQFEDRHVQSFTLSVISILALGSRSMQLVS